MNSVDLADWCDGIGEVHKGFKNYDDSTSDYGNLSATLQKMRTNAHSALMNFHERLKLKLEIYPHLMQTNGVSHALIIARSLGKGDFQG